MYIPLNGLFYHEIGTILNVWLHLSKAMVVGIAAGAALESLG